MVISIWVLSVFLSLMTLWVSFDIRNLFSALLGVVVLFVTTVVYIRIYLAVRRHKNQIQALQVQQVAQTGEMAHFSSVIKSAVSMYTSCIWFVICLL